ncbi:MAG: adenylate/guanylate cyclase domain-containing protein [Ruminococcaceae bacterium]|nr:adenylate/guanylate cyclase domain-containing protein [Oscillospiraceae bacterium]
MVKKIISFIIILVAYTVLGAAAIFSTSNFGLGFGGENETLNTAYAMDRAGNIYYISDDGEERSLICIDSSGKRLYERSLDAETFGDSFYVGQIYVEHDKNIYLTVYSYNKETMFVENVEVHTFHEDGSYAERIFNQKISRYMNSRSNVISSFSENDTNIFFALVDGKKAEVFSAPKSNSELAAKVAEYSLTDEQIYGAYTSDAKELYVGTADGITVYDENGSHIIFKNTDAIFDRFWNGIDQFYAMDSATGDIYTVSGDRSVSYTVSGARVINAEDGLSISDMDDISVGITGNIFGTVRSESEQLYTGSFSLMYRVYTDSVDRGALVNSVLVLAVVVVLIIVLTILTWDFYCGILKMNMSILLRQSLLIIMLISIMLFSLSNFIIIPQVENIVTSNYRHEAQIVANSFEDSLSGSIGNVQASYEEYESYLRSYGEVIAQEDEDDFAGDNEKPQIHIIERSENRSNIIASGEMYPKGYPADSLFYLMDLTEKLDQMTERELFISGRSLDGEKLYLIREISLPMTANKTYIVVGLRLSGLSEAVDDISAVINRFLLIGGIVLVAIFVIIENITAGAVRKLKKSVDRIASGEYDAAVTINTGDEVEDLSKSVKALSVHIVEKTTSLEKLNNSYYRFVPLSFLKNLGETQIERVSKSLNAKRKMAVMYLNFEFSQNLAGMETEEIFESINSVFEQIVPIISNNGGTAYNFLYNGFYAIFPESAEDALQAAIRVRESISAYNEARKAMGKRSVDMRVVISEDNVMLGFIGDESRMEPTAVAGAINQAEEIEKLCRDSGLYIICTESVFRSLPEGKYRNRCIGRYNSEDLGEVKLYDMFDSDPYSLIKLKEQYMMRFELAVNLFEKKDFVHAKSQFMDIVKYASDDGVSRNYMYLAEYNSTSEKPQLTYVVFNEFGS